jgi:DNA-binding SARP family transcriptional activator/TolB-like protein
MDYRPIHPASDAIARANGQGTVAAFTDEVLGPQAPCFRLQALGPFSLVGDAGSVNLGSKKLCGLLAFLACASGPQRRERLMSLLWGSHFQLQAQQNLRKALFRLRRALGADIILSNDELVWLRPGAVTCDVLHFKNLIEEGSHESLCEAADHYKDLFLSNLSIREENWIEWMTEQRRRLEGLVVEALVRLSESEAKRGDFQRALAIAHRAATINELREDAHRVIIRSLAVLGRTAEALKHYDQLAALLKRELDVEPNADSRSLAYELRTWSDHFNEQRQSVCKQSIKDEAPVGDRVSPPPVISEQDGGPCLHPGPALLPQAVAVANPRRSRSPRWHTYLPFGQDLTARVLSAFAVLSIVTVSYLGFVALRLSSPVTMPVLSLGPGMASIAVLPFTQPTNDKESRLAANLIMDDLTNILSRIPDIRFRPLQASQRRSLEAASVAEELNVFYVLEGSVRIQSGKLRVNAELISQKGVQVWSDFFERDSAQGDAARDEIVKGIGRSLQVEIAKANRVRVASIQSDRPEIRDLLAIGWTAIFGSSTADTLAQAEEAFSEVLKRDPELPSALVGLAAHHVTMVGNLFTVDRERYLGEAEQLLDRALRRVPEKSPPYFYLGILHRLRGELKLALGAFAHSTDLSPSFAPGYAHRGSVLTRLGLMNEALDQIHYAMRISPKDPNFPVWAQFAGTAELERGRDAAALEWYLRALAVSPRSRVVHALLASAYALTGDTAKAAEYAAKFRQLTAGFSDTQRLDMLGASWKRPEEPHRLLDGCRLALASE